MNAIARPDEAQIVSLPAVTPMSMIERAVEKGADVAMIEKLMELQERNERNVGRRAFDQAIAKAKAEIPPILKNRHVNYKNKSGDVTDYRHEDLAEIARTVDPILSRYGLSYRFRTNQSADGITVACIVSHEAGYSEETTLRSGADASGGKNSIQAVGSAVTYLQRYTLKAALGLAAAQDDDGAGSDKTPGNENLTEEQFRELQDLIEKAGIAEEVVLKAYKVSALHFLPQRDFGAAKNRLLASIQTRGGK
ncbi:MAG: ERF family protein [Niabella sp.]